MTIALTGATGFVGQAVLDAAEAKHIEVNALTRRTQPDRKGVNWVRGDLGDRRALIRMVDGVEAVIHVAGAVNAADADGFEAANVQGTLAVVETALAAGVRRFIYVSSLSAREPQLSAYGASKRRAEKIVAASGMDWTIIRPPAVYGPRDTEMFELFRAAKWGVVPMPPEAGRTSVIHADDLATLLIALIHGGEDVTHRVFEPDDGQPGGWSHKELAEAIGAAMGRKPWVPHMSRGALDWISRIESWVRPGKVKLSADRVAYMVHPDWVVSDGRAVPSRRWRPRVRTQDGLNATAGWYRQQGWL